MEAIAANAEAALAPMGRTAPVLVVEDDPGLQTILAYFLKRGGYTVVTASNGEEALDVLRAGTEPCLILLDLMMPVMDGVQFRSLQMEDPRLSRLPVILCSARPGLEATAAQLKAAAHVQKPFDFDLLLDLVNAHRLV